MKVKLTLLEVRPPVWRKLLLSPEISLGQLHHIIQAAMGWEDAHAHRFSAGIVRYSDPRFELDDSSTDERKVFLSDILTKPGDRLTYEYDFGDDWRHELLCEELVEADLGTRLAVCIDGARACPPEDCDGPMGYEDMLHILKDPKHREYKATREWVGGRFHPDSFSVDEVNDALSQFVRRKGTIYGRRSRSRKPTKQQDAF